MPSLLVFNRDPLLLSVNKYIVYTFTVCRGGGGVWGHIRGGGLRHKVPYRPILSGHLALLSISLIFLRSWFHSIAECFTVYYKTYLRALSPSKNNLTYLCAGDFMGSNSGVQISNLTSRIADLETQIVPLVDRIGQIDR
jgi:hypothetical protein